MGRTPSDEDTRALGIMVAPDGTGCPPGLERLSKGKTCSPLVVRHVTEPKARAATARRSLAEKGRWPRPTPKRTVGSYWPYATTVWDYVNRAMPFNQPGTLSHDEVYAVAAYVLFLNDIVGEKQVLNARSLPLIKMPNRDGFVSDPRPDIRARRPE